MGLVCCKSFLDIGIVLLSIADATVSIIIEGTVKKFVIGISIRLHNNQGVHTISKRISILRDRNQGVIRLYFIVALVADLIRISN